jgi:hypothetical protein
LGKASTSTLMRLARSVRLCSPCGFASGRQALGSVARRCVGLTCGFALFLRLCSSHLCVFCRLLMAAIASNRAVISVV